MSHAHARKQRGSNKGTRACPTAPFCTQVFRPWGEYNCNERPFSSRRLRQDIAGGKPETRHKSIEVRTSSDRRFRVVDPRSVLGLEQRIPVSGQKNPSVSKHVHATCVSRHHADLVRCGKKDGIVQVHARGYTQPNRRECFSFIFLCSEAS